MIPALWTLVSLAFAGSVHHEIGLHELTDRASGVVHGVVVLTEARATPTGITTRVVVAVEDTLLGPKRDEVSFELPGGTVNGLRQAVGGVPQWSEGDEVVVFLPREGQVSLRGLFTVEHGALIDPMPQREPAFPLDLRALRAALLRP